MGKLIPTVGEKQLTIIDLPRQLDICKSIDLGLLVSVYYGKRLKRTYLEFRESKLSQKLRH